MKTYARIDAGSVVELFQTDSDITQMFHPDLIWIDVTDLDPQPGQQWTYDGTTFAAPIPWAPSPADTLLTNTSTRDSLLSQAALAIAPLQDAVDLDDATPDEADLLKKWKQYRVAVNRIDLVLLAPAWPAAPE